LGGGGEELGGLGERLRGAASLINKEPVVGRRGWVAGVRCNFEELSGGGVVRVKEIGRASCRERV